MIVKDGISKNFEGKYDFDYTQDLDTDILHLSTDESGVKTANGLTYFYAYQFNPKADYNEVKTFRKLFKHNYRDSHYFYNDDVFDFIEVGMLHMDHFKKLESFDIVFMTDFGNGTSAGVMALLDSMLLEYTNGSFLDVRLVKQTYENVKFDRGKAKQAIISTNKYSNDYQAERAVRSMEDTFNQLKTSGELFKMKRYLPAAGRVGFYDFLRFDTEEHKNAFMCMENGSEALICDDFVTSGSTIKEIKRYLHSINPNVNITVFVLIDQMREY